MERLISEMNEISHLRHFGVELGGTQPTVNAALVHRQFAFLPGEICTEGGVLDDDSPGSDHTGLSMVQALRRAARCMRRIGSNHHRRHSASRGNARREGAEVSSGHSSVSVLHESGRS